MTLQELEQIQPDENGIITLTVDGKLRRFVKEKLLKHYERNGEAPSTGKLDEKKQVVKKSVKIRPVKKVTAKQPVGSHLKRPVIATLPTGEEIRYDSSVDASIALKIDKTNIPHALSGKYKHVNGIVFRRAV